MNKSHCFVLLTGDYPNIGDAVIRRESLLWARRVSPHVHAFVGRAPTVWIDQIGVIPADTVYKQSDLGKFIGVLIRSSRPTLVLEPGEVDLRDNQYKWEILILMFTMIVRLRQGVIIRPPRSLRGAGRIVPRLHMLGVRLSQVSLWRERASLRRAGRGELAPDIGFALAPFGGSDVERTSVIVSLRASRPFPSDQWFSAVQEYADSRKLQLMIASQVRDDEVRTLELSDRLGCLGVTFDTRDDIEQEQVLRSLYAKSEIVISDRLHVLIVAAVGGAVPVELVPSPAPKIAQHFDTIMVEGVTKDSSTLTTAEMVGFLRQAYDRKDLVRQRVLDARLSLLKFALE